MTTQIDAAGAYVTIESGNRTILMHRDEYRDLQDAISARREIDELFDDKATTVDGVFYSFSTGRGEIAATIYREPSWDHGPWTRYINAWDALADYAELTGDVLLIDKVQELRPSEYDLEDN
jgi:hypothetical protein